MYPNLHQVAGCAGCAPAGAYRIIVTAYDRTPGLQPVKRYLLSLTFAARRDADAFAAAFALPSLPHQVVTAETAAADLLDLETAQPSRTYTRTGRIWDLAAEPCREWQREPAAVEPCREWQREPAAVELFAALLEATR